MAHVPLSCAPCLLYSLYVLCCVFFFLLKKIFFSLSTIFFFLFFFFLLSFSFFMWVSSALCFTIGLLWCKALSEVEVEQRTLLDFQPHCRSDDERLVSWYGHTFNETRHSLFFNYHSWKPKWLWFLTFFLISFCNFLRILCLVKLF